MSQLKASNSKNEEKMRIKQEITAKYTQMSKDNGGLIADDGNYKF